MTKIDGGLWPVVKSHLVGWDFQRIETGLTGLGVPDVNGCKLGHDVWIELKATDGWKPFIRPEQIAWAERRARHGGKVFLFVRRHCVAGVRRESADELWIYRADRIRMVATDGLKTNPPVLFYTGGSSKWDWGAVNELLLS